MATMAEIIAEIQGFNKLFDLTRDGLGPEMAQAAAGGILDALDAEVDYDLQPFAPLSPSYSQWKQTHQPGPIGRLYGLMKEPRHVLGQVAVSADSMSQTYGESDDARAEATSFQEGGGNQPPRRFYALNPLALDAVTKVVDRYFAAKLR